MQYIESKEVFWFLVEIIKMLFPHAGLNIVIALNPRDPKVKSAGKVKPAGVALDSSAEGRG